MGCLCSCCVRHDVGEGYNAYFPIAESQWPIVYSPFYNIRFGGLENLHPFDSKKWGRVYDILEASGMVRQETIVEPREVSREALLTVHTQRYLNSLDSPCTVAAITEVPPVACLCPCLIEKYVLRPFRYHTAGTILAARLAVERGWAINIGGGFHHCSSDSGGGFCVYADITLAIRFLFDQVEHIKRAMIVDLDAHQGNGHEHDFMDDENVYIMDVYNFDIYPFDRRAKRGIQRNVTLQHFTEDDEYLRIVTRNLQQAFGEFNPDIVVYNAGTDVLEGDSLGMLSITEQGIIKRDEIVFSVVRGKEIPIVMVTSGGYQRRTAEVIARSILNLRNKRLIDNGPSAQ